MRFLIINTSLIGILLFTSLSLAENVYLEDYCKKMNGTIINEWHCPASGVVRKDEFCSAMNADAQPLIFNGCNSDNQDGYRIRFFKACVIHDLCYHNEPAVSSKTKAACDEMFLDNMLQICKEDSRDAQKALLCKTFAKSYYKAVVKKGKPSWECSKESARYPTDMTELPVVIPTKN
jgi:hypothetical protein